MLAVTILPEPLLLFGAGPEGMPNAYQRYITWLIAKEMITVNWRDEKPAIAQWKQRLRQTCTLE